MASTINFKRIRYHNFMSFADQEWDFSTPGDIFLISGKNYDLRQDDSGVSASNGSGKTNLVQGLMYALYGQFPYKIHNGNILNKYSKKLDADGYTMRVELDFDICKDDSAVEYKVIRGTQKGSASTVRLSLLEKKGADWEDISKSTSAVTQQAIEEILCMGMQTFQRLVMLSFDPAFNFFRMNASQKRDFIQALFDTGTYTDMWELIKKDLSRFSMALQGEKVKLNTLQGQLARCEDDIKAYANTAKEQEKELRTRVESLKANDLPSLDEKRKAFEKQLEQKKSDVASVTEKSTKYSQVSEKIRIRLHGYEQTTRMLKSNIEGFKREMAKHYGILSLLCDDCKGKVRGAYRIDEYEKGIAESTSQLEQQASDMAKLQDALNKVNEEASKVLEEKLKVEREVRQIESQIVGLQVEEQSTRTTITELNRRIEEIANSISDPKKIPMLGTFRTLKKEIAQCEGDIEKSEDDLFYLNLCERVVSPDSVRKNLVSRVIQNINDLVNRYLDELNTTIRCEFDDQLDKFTIKAPQGWSMDYQNLSKGEQMKLLLATQLAFRRFLLLRYNLGCNCFILDEVVDQNFDTLSISRILDVLLDVAMKEKMHIYIISHRGEVSRLTDDLVEAKPDTRSAVHRILVEKRDNISTISSVD